MEYNEKQTAGKYPLELNFWNKSTKIKNRVGGYEDDFIEIKEGLGTPRF